MVAENTEPLAAAVQALAAAFAADDPKGIHYASRALVAAVHSLDGMLVGLGIRGADLDDLRQELLACLYTELRDGRALLAPRAWVRVVARNLALDTLRRRSRQRTTPLAPEALIERSGAYTFAGLFAKELEEHERDTSRARVARFLEAYIEMANTLRPPRGHHLRAWYARRIQGRSIADITRELAPRAASDLVSKWVQRGAVLVVALAETDPDLDRAAAMRRAS